MNTYLDCSQKWWWGKQGWIEKQTPEPLGLGTALHAAIAAHFRGEDANAVYDAEIRKIFKGVPGRDLLTIGPHMLGKLFANDTFKRLKISPNSIEKPLKKSIGGLVLVGVADAVGELDGTKVIIDWKTASNPYDEEFYTTMSEQLMAYKILTDNTDLASERYGYCIIGKKQFKGADPQWLWLDNISPDRIDQYISKLGIIAQRMERGEHFKQPDERKCVSKGPWQTGCAFYELCSNKPPTKVSKNDF